MPPVFPFTVKVTLLPNLKQIDARKFPAAANSRKSKTAVPDCCRPSSFVSMLTSAATKFASRASVRRTFVCQISGCVPTTPDQ